MNMDAVTQKESSENSEISIKDCIVSRRKTLIPTALQLNCEIYVSAIELWGPWGQEFGYSPLNLWT